VRHNNGFSSIVRVPPPYTSVYEIQTLEYGKDIYDLDISPDGSTLVGSYIQVSGRQQLVAIDLPALLTGSPNVQVLYEFENNAPANFVFSPDGRYLYGTSYFTGVSNVFRWDVAAKTMSAVTNCETGYFRPVPVGADSLLVFRYRGAGFQPVMIPIEPREDLSAVRYLGQEIVDRHPVVTTWNVGSPMKVNIDSLKTYEGEYQGFGALGLASVYPVVQGYKDDVGVGLHASFADRLGIHAIDATAVYTPNRGLAESERFHAAASYRYWEWKFSGAYNASDFYDLFGPTKTSRKGYSLGVEYASTLVNDRPASLELTIAATGYGGLERLPDYQNISTGFDKFAIASAALRYKRVLKTIGAVDGEKGTQWGLSTAGTLVQGFQLPVDHASLWFRTAAGYSPGDRNSPFANFFFGGFGNNWVDYQEVKRYRSTSSFPGTELNETGGTTFGKLMVELTLPPLRFKRIGIPNFYATWAHVTLFGTGLVVNPDDRARKQTLGNAGAQADIKFVLFTSMETTLSVGYAAAFERGVGLRKEFMISLKIL
jgi:hypothetical protein